MFKQLVLALGALSATSAVNAQSGACGANVSWTITDDTITISGEGDMEDYWFNGVYTSEKFPSWYPFKDLIKHVVFEPGVTSVGAHSFCDYKQLESVTFSQSITKINAGAFKNCSALTEITLPENLETFGHYETGLYSYSGAAFEGCVGLSQLYIPEKVTFVGGGTFKNCKGLKKVIWAAENATLGSENRLTTAPNTFYGSPIQEVEFTSNVKRVGAQLFYEKNLLSLKTGGNIEICEPDALYLGSDVFIGKLEGSVMIDHALYAYYHSEPTPYSIVLPEGTTSITAGAIKNNEKFLVSLTIPESFYYMPLNSLAGCTSLSTLNWNARTCEFAYDGTFSSALFTVNFGESVEEIGKYMFRGCTGLKTLQFPASLKKIKEKSLDGCSGLKELVIPDGVTEIELQINIPAIEKLYIGKSVTTLTGFNRCPALKSVYWNARNCNDYDGASITGNPYIKTDIESAIIGPDVERLPADCFSCNKAPLFSVDFSYAKSLRAIGEGAFGLCTNLSDIYLPEGLTQLESLFYNSGISTLFIPESVTDYRYLYEVKAADKVIIAGNMLRNNHPNTTNVEYYVPNPQLYIDTEGASWKNISEKIHPLVKESDDSRHDFILDNGSVDFSAHGLTCNLPGYEVTFDFEANGIQPGSYSSVRATFNGNNTFSANIPFSYTIRDKESGIKDCATDSSAGEYWTVDGIKVAEPKPGIVYIFKQGATSRKIYVGI